MEACVAHNSSRKEVQCVRQLVFIYNRVHDVIMMKNTYDTCDTYTSNHDHGGSMAGE